MNMAMQALLMENGATNATIDNELGHRIADPLVVLGKRVGSHVARGWAYQIIGLAGAQLEFLASNQPKSS